MRACRSSRASSTPSYCSTSAPGIEPLPHAALVQTRTLLFEALEEQVLFDVLARSLKYSELLVSRIVLQMLDVPHSLNSLAFVHFVHVSACEHTGLQYIHYKGALHLRLSPQPVLMSYSGRRAGVRVKLMPPPSLVAVPSAPCCRHDNRAHFACHWSGPLTRSKRRTASRTTSADSWHCKWCCANASWDFWSVGAIVAVLYAANISHGF